MRRLAPALLFVAGCTSTSAEPLCAHGVAITPNGSSVFATRYCQDDAAVTTKAGVYRIDPTSFAVETIASDGGGWTPAAINATDDRIALTVRADGGDYAEIRGHDGAQMAKGAQFGVTLFDPFFLADGGLFVGYPKGVLHLPPGLTGGVLDELRDDIRSIHVVGTELVVGSFRGKRVFLFDASDPTDIDTVENVVRGAVEVLLFPDAQTIAVVNPDDQVIELYDRMLERQRSLMTGADPRAIALSADGNRMAVVEGGNASPDSQQVGALRVYDLTTDTEIAMVEMPGRPDVVALSSDGTTAFIARTFQGKAQLDIPGQVGLVAVDVAAQTIRDVPLQ